MAGGWKPIETAPLDGTWVLIFAQMRKGKRATVAKYIKWYGGQWMIGDHKCGVRETEYDLCVESASHWMPLPDPPGAK